MHYFPLYCRFFYYLINTNGLSQLYTLDLRQSQTLRSVASSVIDIRGFKHSFSLNPQDNTLLLSDQETGNIQRCSSDLINCIVYINRLALERNSGRMHVGKFNCYKIIDQQSLEQYNTISAKAQI